ncbi:MAG: 4-hydroxy-3-methylbut-2-en-1-yl diphosphate synthase [Gemmatimonadaceae bacterium 4484_173]|nr:MAG: 4-hydroxy-3-methylbut-2-en-1-yl diphosphate synthase [Gemmatimonadaceae bacterium 4484_173]RKZ04321.1 MAG: 4-hydroxy-3-methylbut-2-en-1-yl diphosphate synthase [Candidatus Fermentibacteria bacterium]
MSSRLGVQIGKVSIGAGAPVAVQSMTNTPTSDHDSTLQQIYKLATLGAEIVRVSVPDDQSADSLFRIVEKSPVPVVADIHFRADLAIKSLQAGVHKLRLNPGNIRLAEDVHRIAELAGSKGVPIRIGVNSGSIPGDLREKYSGVNEDSMWAAAERHIALLTETGFRNIVLSLKSSDPMLTVRVNRKASRECPYPLHLGVTEAGPRGTAGIRSAVAMGILLDEGIGDTIRVSISGSPEPEPVAGWEILSSLDLRHRFIRIVSCPTCARTRLNVEDLALKVQKMVQGHRLPVTVAVMGCEVNGPGEARDADLAVIGTPTGLLLWKNGKSLGAVPEDKLETRLMEELNNIERRH